MKKSISTGLLASILAIGALTSCSAPCSHEGGEATCLELAICDKCGEEYGELDTNNHSFVAGDITLAPTCTEDGTQEYNCACGATTTEVLPATGHSHSTEWTTDDTHHWHACGCGDKADYTEHNYTIEGEVTVEPKCTTEGSQTYACVCGATTQKPLPSLGGHIDENQDVYCDREGCTSKVIKPSGTEVPLAWAVAAINTNVSLDKYYVRGTVKEITDNNNGMLYLTDGTTDLYVNLIKGADGESYSKLPQRALVGDVIRVYGQLKKDTSKQIPSIYSCTMEIIEHEHSFGEATCTKPATCACGITSGEALGHSSTDSDTLCDRCGFDTTLTVKYMKIATEEGMDTTMTNVARWDSEPLHFSIAKGSGTNMYTTSNDHARLYKNNTFCVFTTLPNMIYEITYHMPVTTTSDGLSKLANIFKAEGHQTTIVDTSVTIQIAGIDNVRFTNTSGSTLKITGITVAYK